VEIQFQKVVLSVDIFVVKMNRKKYIRKILSARNTEDYVKSVLTAEWNLKQRLMIEDLKCILNEN